MNARTSPLLLSSSPSAPSSPKVSLFTTALTIWRASVVVALLATLLNPWMLSRLPIRLRLPIGRSTSSASISSATGALASSGRPGLTKLTRSSEGAKGVHTTGKQKAQEVPSTYYGSATNSAAEVASSLRSMVSLTDRSLNGTSSVKSGEDETVPEAFGNFDRIVGPLKLDYANVKLAKWQSRETGLTVVWVDMEGQRLVRDDGRRYSTDGNTASRSQAPWSTDTSPVSRARLAGGGKTLMGTLSQWRPRSLTILAALIH